MLNREILSLQVGQAGNQIGDAFWNLLLTEHGIDHIGEYTGSDPTQLSRVGVYFSEREVKGQGIRYQPRSLQIDLEGGVCNRLRSGTLGGLFHPDSWICGEPGAGNCYAKGFYTEGAEIADSIIESVRKSTEHCDALQGFQLTHSIGGGTGSGLGCLLLSKLREEFPDTMLTTFSIFPSPNVSETVVEPYNGLLSTHELLGSTDMTICLDNEALYNICDLSLKMKRPHYSDLNGLIAKVMCGVSTSLRFPGQLNGDLRKLAMNLIPFARLHFLMPSYAPIYDIKTAAYHKYSVQELATALFDRRNVFAACDPRQGRYLTAATIFRGDVSSLEAEVSMQEIQSRNSAHFTEWIPDNVSISLVSVPPPGMQRAAMALSNSTCTQELFRRTLETFKAMFKRKAFLYWYTSEGMDEQEFMEAEFNAQDLLSEYQQYESLEPNTPYEGSEFEDE